MSFHCAQLLVLDDNSTRCHQDQRKPPNYHSQIPSSRELRHNIPNNTPQPSTLSRKPHNLIPKLPLLPLRKITPIPRQQKPSLNKPQLRPNIPFSRLNPLLLLQPNNLIRVLNRSKCVLHTLRFLKKRNDITQTRFEITHWYDTVLRSVWVEQDASDGICGGG